MLAEVLAYHGADLSHTPEYGWRSIRCPYHDDAHESASVHLERGAFKCHACDMKGDAIGLIMKKEGLGYLDALTFASEVLGQSVGQVSRPAKRRQPSRWRDRLFPESRDSDDSYP